jgi:hypothetical protein
MFNWILTLLLGSAICANAQSRPRLCEHCDQAGLQVAVSVRYYENDKGIIVFYFRNLGESYWKVEKVRCEFYDRSNRQLFSQSYDMQRFEVSSRTSSIQAHTREVFNLPRDAKHSCQIEAAVRGR